MLWTIVFLGNDTLAESSQFIAMLVCAIAIYGISRLMDRSEKSASFNALLFLSFPVVAMQATTTQTDLFVAAMIACAFYFLASGFQQKQKSSLVVSSLAIALAIGSKQTAFFVLPGYLILCLFLWLKNRKSVPGAPIADHCRPLFFHFRRFDILYQPFLFSRLFRTSRFSRGRDKDLQQQGYRGGPAFEFAASRLQFHRPLRAGIALEKLFHQSQGPCL